MYAIEAGNVGQVLVGGLWLVPEAGTFEILSGHRFLGDIAPVFRFLDAEGLPVMGRLSSIAAVRLASEPIVEAGQQFPQPPGFAEAHAPSFAPGRPPNVSTPMIFPGAMVEDVPASGPVPGEEQE